VFANIVEEVLAADFGEPDLAQFAARRGVGGVARDRAPPLKRDRANALAADPRPAPRP